MSARNIAFAVGGANGISKARVTRLCIKGSSRAIFQPIHRLGNFMEMRLRPKRRGRMEVKFSSGAFHFCSAEASD